MYTCKEIGRIKTKGCWDQIITGIFNDGIQVGEYIKGYSAPPQETFAPFIGSDGKQYAVISEKDYTLATVISLPDCKVACIEENPRPGFGFCPIEIHVPKLYALKALSNDPNRPPEFSTFTSTEENEDDELNSDEWIIHQPLFALVGGCVWGDDSCEKLEIYDLKDVPNKITRLAPFDYMELSSGNLRDLVKVWTWDLKNYHFTISSLSFKKWTI